MITTNKELADWVFDRLAQGQNEEVGSMDSIEMNGHEVVIQVSSIDEKDNHYCDVFIDCGYIYSDYINNNTPYETILQEIEKYDVEQKTKEK